MQGGTGQASSNDYFRQLFMAQVTDSEQIFWVKNSPVASKSPPDDKVAQGGVPQQNEILKAGDCHWAYITEQSQTSKGSRPLILDGYKSGTTEFDRDLWDLKVVVCRIDSSAKPMRMRVADGLVLDGSNKDILSSEADAWDGSGESPRQLIEQPRGKAN